MKLTAAAVLSCFVLAIALSAQPASAAGAKQVAGSITAASAGAIELGKPPDVGPPNVPPTTKPVKPPQPPKPDRSERNPNDDNGKDEDPDDGDAGSGNDDKTKKNDGRERD